MFTFHDFYLEKDLGDAVAGCQEIIRKLMIMLGDPGRNWEGLTAREAEVMVYVVKEVDGVPQFVVKLMETLLDNSHREERLVMRESATQTSQEMARKVLDPGGGASQ